MNKMNPAAAMVRATDQAVGVWGGTRIVCAGSLRPSARRHSTRAALQASCPLTADCAPHGAASGCQRCARAAVSSGEFLSMSSPQAAYTRHMATAASEISNTATVTPIGTGRPWLSRMPPGLFAIPFGLLGLAGAWRRMAAFRIEATDLVASFLLAVATGVLELLLILWIVKCVRFRDDVRRDFAHPVQGAMLSLVPLTILLAVSLWLPQWPHYRSLAVWLVSGALAAQAVVVWRVVSRVATGDLPADMVTPALYLPPVGGGLIGALALASLGAHGWAVLVFGMGLAAWWLLEARVLNRLFVGPLPPPLRATLGVELAPAPVATLAALTLWPTLHADVVLLALGVACGPLIAVLARWQWWANMPFSAAHWSFSFPVAALASVIVEAVRRGGWPSQVAWVAVLMATSVIAYLGIRSVLLLFRGRLIPPG